MPWAELGTASLPGRRLTATKCYVHLSQEPCVAPCPSSCRWLGWLCWLRWLCSYSTATWASTTNAVPVCMILVIVLEARPRAGAIKATQATKPLTSWKGSGQPLSGAREAWSAPNVPWPLSPRLLSSWPLFSRPTPHAAGRELGSFSLWIPPSFVLSPNVPVTNARSIWLRFGAFLSPPARFLRIHWPLYFPPRSRPTLHAPTSGVRSCADPPPLATA